MITVSTASLVGLLADAVQTSDKSGKLDIGVHLATHRDAYGDEPGQMDLLAATSTDRWVVGHGFIPVEGQLMTCVWPVDQAQMVIKLCENHLKSHGKDHTVDIEVVQMMPSGDEEQPRYTVTLRETPALFDADTEYQFPAHSEVGFPLKASWRALNGMTVDRKFRETVETVWSPRVLAAITAVAKRRREPMHWYRKSGTTVRRIQIGTAWIGAAHPAPLGLGESSTEPSIDPLLPRPDGIEDEIVVVDGEFVDDGPLALEQAPLELEAGPGDVIDAEVIDDEEDASDPDYEVDETNTDTDDDAGEGDEPESGAE